MGWLAWSAGGDTGRAHPSVTVDSSIEQGALLIEGPLPSDMRAMTLLEVACLHPFPCLLRIQSIPGEGFSILLTRGKKIFHALISHTLRARTDTFRLTYNWDSRDGSGNLSIEHPGDAALFSRNLTECPPMPGALMLGAISELHNNDTRSGPLSHIGFHKGMLSVGPGATMDYCKAIWSCQGHSI